SRPHPHADPQPAPAQPGLGDRAGARRRRAAGRVRQRHLDRPWRGGGDQRPLRRAPDRRGQPQRADPETALSLLPPLLAAVAAPAAQAARPAAQAGPGLFGAFFALLLVLGLILGLAWLLKRLPGSGLRQADGLRVVASVQLGVKERAVVVEVGGRQLLLGVATGGVNLLHELPGP